ncbi:MAG: hypothetical protein K9G48_12680 [Reyranella sp.]|nr:hypothetical protein [Reyranella sp.]
MTEVPRKPPFPGVEGSPPESPYDMNHMVTIDKLIADLQEISKRFGNTCVYVRRGGLSWGGVALNRRSEDEEHGVFDLQAQHDRDMLQRAGQVERLIAARDSEREARSTVEKALARKDEAMGVLFKRLDAAGVDYSDLLS